MTEVAPRVKQVGELFDDIADLAIALKTLLGGGDVNQVMKVIGYLVTLLDLRATTGMELAHEWLEEIGPEDKPPLKAVKE